MPTPADLFLSPDLTEADARAYLRTLGFRDAAAVDGHLQQMADDLVVREALGRLAPDLIASLLESPDPDAAAAGLSHYVAGRTGRAMLLDYLREDPRALHVLTYILGASPTLSEILVQTPEYFHWLVSQVERSAPDRQDHEEELIAIFATVDDPGEALGILRRWKRRETLRIGTRELLRHDTVHTVAAQLSDLACVAVDFALALVMRQRMDAEGLEKVPGAFAVIGTGRFGAGELSYEPGIDVLCVYEPEDTAGGRAAAFFEQVSLDLAVTLREEAREGRLYQLCSPAWPQPDGRVRACAASAFAGKVLAGAGLRERLALVRARPVGGDVALGARFVAACEPALYASPPAATQSPEADEAHDPGDLEGLTQRLQLAHGSRHPLLRQVGTHGALDALARIGAIPEAERRELDRAYALLRSAEHRRQLGLPDDLSAQVDASRARIQEIARSLGI